MSLFSKTYKSSTGKTLCFSTNSTKEYLDFIENFNYQKYDLIRINNGYNTWFITYKLKT